MTERANRLPNTKPNTGFLMKSTDRTGEQVSRACIGVFARIPTHDHTRTPRARTYVENTRSPVRYVDLKRKYPFGLVFGLVFARSVSNNCRRVA